ncbi:MAG: ATP-binding protein [Candidatus Heritagella sp.]
MKAVKKAGGVLTVFLLCFCLCAFIVTCSFLLFFREIELPRDQLPTAARATFFNILLLSALFTGINQVYRKITVDRPVTKIKRALSAITGGDFSVRLDTQGHGDSFAEIMEQINRMTQELSGVETLRTDFIANVSHELKTPLAVMQNYGTILQQPGLSEEKRIEYARSITDASCRLADLITNILKLNKLENQQIFPTAREYDLSEQLCENLLAFETVWEEKEIDLVTDIAENVRVCADPELLSLVWNNLLSNAFKFTENGGRVWVSLSAGESHATVKIRDTGCGMTPETGAHIFEKFYQGDPSHASQGNGLGLSLVKRVIDILHGEIQVESLYGEGSTFTVRIGRNLHEKLETSL